MLNFKRFLMPSLIFLLGVLLVAVGVLEGDVGLTLFFIIPVIYGTGIYLIGGIFLIMLSFILFFFLSFSGVPASGKRSYDGSYKERRKGPKRKSKYGGVIFIGPIPIFFGKDMSTTKKMMWLGLVIALILVFLYVMIIFL